MFVEFANNTTIYFLKNKALFEISYIKRFPRQKCLTLIKFPNIQSVKVALLKAKN